MMILGIYGASGLGTEYLDVALDINKANKRWDRIVFIDDTPEKMGTELLGVKIMPFEYVKDTFATSDLEIIVAIGEPVVKGKIAKKVKEAGYSLANLVHPTSNIGVDAEVGSGVMIQSWNRIPPLAKIGDNVLIQGTTCMGHGIVIGENSVISSLVFIGGATTIGSNTYIAPHTCVRNMVNIGSNSIVGMGSVVTKDIPDNVVAFGNPCKVMRSNENGKVFSK